jgi:serine/threonine-protein kinase
VNFLAQTEPAISLPTVKGNPDMEPTAGMQIGSYLLRERIGSPNMGDVWRAEPVNGPEQSVAIKSLHIRHAGDAALRSRFETECEVHQSLQHPGIVPVIECLLHGRERYLVMPFIGGGSLEDRLRNGAMTEPVAIRLAIQILEALDYAHRNGVLHRDIKPSNILCAGDSALVTDFGIAHSLRHRTSRVGDTSGTLAYMSPEQIQSAANADQRSDVYGFGCVLYEMLTGRPPFPLEESAICSPDELKLMHVRQLPIPPGRFHRGLDPRVEAIVLRALAKDPADRFPGCGSFALALRNLAETQADVPIRPAAVWAWVGAAAAVAGILTVVIG